MGVLHRKPKDNEVILVLKKLGKVEFYLTEKKDYSDVPRILLGSS